MVTHDERFAEFVAAKRQEEAATVKVTWRKVSAMTGGGWSGLGPNGALVYVREPKTPRWDGAKYEYGTVDGKVRTSRGGATTLRAAKDKAAKLFEPGPLPIDRVPDADEMFRTPAGEIKRFGSFTAADLRAAIDEGKRA